VSDRPPASELLRTPGALLTRSDLRELGLERRAVDAVFRECAVVVLPGYLRPLVRVEVPGAPGGLDLLRPLRRSRSADVIEWRR
jgi:hypothetical protein